MRLPAELHSASPAGLPRLAALRARMRKVLRDHDRDLRLLRSVFLVVCLALVTALFGIREAEVRLLRAAATGSAVHWAQFLQTRMHGFEDILDAGLVSEDDRTTLEFAGAAGGVRNYQVIRADGVVALSSWSGNFRDAIDPDTVQAVIRDGSILTEVNEASVAGRRAVVAQAYVPLSAGNGRRGALMVDVDVTHEAERYRRIGNGAFLLLIGLLLPPGGACAWLVRRSIREQRQTEQLQRQRGQILEQLTKGVDLDEVLAQIARFAEQHHSGARCTILALDVHGPHATEAAVGTESLGETVWQTPLRATSGTLLGSFTLDCRDPHQARMAALGPAETLAQLAAVAVECRQAESALAEMRQRHELILTAAGDGIFGIDADAYITFANPAAARLLGCDGTELIGLRASALIDDAGARDGSADPLSATLSDGRGRHLEQFLLTRLDGSAFPADLMVTPVGDDATDLRAVVVFHDISSRIQAQRQLRRARDEAESASRAKSSFLAHMSHELRTPLNAIIGFSEIMTMQRMGPIHSTQYLEYAQDIQQSGEHLLSLINDLLDLSKIEAGKLELAEQVVELPPLLERCVAFVSEALRVKQLAFALDIEPGLTRLHGDERKLKQVVVNLLSNAVKFTESGGRIVLAARRDDHDGAVIEVADNGIGIAPEDREKVMAPFGQVDDSLSRDHEGTGLGLPLAKALVELHGGRLELISAPRRGTTARILLPARALPGKDASTAA